jgi:nucleoside-diphosphate-sugar epimerase
MTVLVTGAAGFVGSHVVKALLCGDGASLGQTERLHVVGVDSMDPYYDPALKEERLRQLLELEGFEFHKGDITDKGFIDSIFETHKPDYVLNFAAKVGVRHSVEHPDQYISTNISGFYNILEACRRNPVRHLVYASSSSVYGANTKVPYSVEDKVDAPVSLYAATKRSNEMMAHSYSHLYGIPSTGLRFFTVYGPAGRPDMAYYKFTERLVRGEKIQLYNYGECKRDFTYIDDIVRGVVMVLAQPPKAKEGAPSAIYNIGNSNPENLLDFVRILQEELVEAGVLPQDYDFEAHRELMPMQPGDVAVTYADVSGLERDFGFRPTTPLRNGLKAFAQWYKKYNRL